jgi:hypothetical protein
MIQAQTKSEFHRLCEREASLTRQLATAEPGRDRLDIRNALLGVRNQIFELRRQMIDQLGDHEAA